MEETFEGSPRRARVAPSSISSMGSLLLQGWTMLADSCDHCGVPLMRRGGETVCVNCSESEAPAGPSIAPPPPVANGNGNGVHDAGCYSSDEEALLAAAPPPLRERLRTAGASAAEQSSTVGVHNIPAQHSSAEEDTATQYIAERMLEGWALLAEHCPRCSTPLIRSKEGQIFCAKCRLPVVREADLPTATSAAAAPAAPASSGMNLAALPVPAAAPATAAATPAMGDVRQSVAAAQAAVASRMALASGLLAGAAHEDAVRQLGEIRECASALKELVGVQLALGN